MEPLANNSQMRREYLLQQEKTRQRYLNLLEEFHDDRGRLGLPELGKDRTPLGILKTADLREYFAGRQGLGERRHYMEARKALNKIVKPTSKKNDLALFEFRRIAYRADRMNQRMARFIPARARSAPQRP